jgi:hypothetical protein
VAGDCNFDVFALNSVLLSGWSMAYDMMMVIELTIWFDVLNNEQPERK